MTAQLADTGIGRFQPKEPSTEERGFDALLYLASLWRDQQLTEADLPLIDLVERQLIITRAAAESARIVSAASMVATTTSRLSTAPTFTTRWAQLCEAVDRRESRDPDDSEVSVVVLDTAVRVAAIECYWGGPRRVVDAAAPAAFGATL